MSKRPVRQRFVTFFLLLLLCIGFFAYGETAYGARQETASGLDAVSLAYYIQDAQAKERILSAIGRGAKVTFTFDEEGNVVAYRAVIPDQVIPGEKKYWKDMTEGEKKAALTILRTPGNDPYAPASKEIGGKTYRLNENLWYQKGLIVYGDSFGGTSSQGPRYWGYDVNGGYFPNDDFPRDSDSGRQPWEKDWWTTGEIRESPAARRLIGTHALTDAFSRTDKLETARAFLKENPGWSRAGLDETYLLSHFFFNSVITDGGLTAGQFIGVQENAGKLWYQTFSVSQAQQRFTVVPGSVVDGDVIVWKIEDPEPEPEVPDPEEEIPPPPAEEEDIQASAILSLPVFTYEGHPAAARDLSIYTIDGEVWSAYRALKAGKTSNRFTIEEKDVGTVSKKTILEAAVTFEKAGNYNVRLRIAPKGGEYLYDVKPIEVRKSPTILHSLTGTKKQNRKQVINLSVAVHPKYPLTDCKVEIQSLATGETVKLNHLLGQGENQLKNSETIKTRPIEALESDEYFVNCKLEFLTKNSSEEDFRYTVFVQDSRGVTDQVSADFTVVPDLPPNAAIQLEEFYLREEGTDTARITASDATTTDGDQIERTWSYRLAPSGAIPEELDLNPEGFSPLANAPGFQDLSMETGRLQRVGFEKAGVGAFALQLIAKDVWTEETLEEYISPEDYLWDTTIASSQVTNVAPVVSLKAVESQSAEILLLAEGDEDYEKLKGAASALRVSLLEKGVDGRIMVKQSAPAASNTASGRNQIPLSTFTVKEPFGYEGSWTFLGGSGFLVDDSRLYTVTASWPLTGLNEMPKPPYVITAYDCASGEVDWTFTLTDEIMPVNTMGRWHTNDSRLAVDAEGAYLFFRNGAGKTLILDRNTGAYQTVLSFEVGDHNRSDEEGIYSFREDGVHWISTRGQGIKPIYKGTVYGDQAQLVEGNSHFLVKESGALCRGVFDLKTRKVTLERLSFNRTEGDSVKYSLLGVARDGALFVHGIEMDKDNCPATLRVFDSRNREVRRIDAKKTNEGTIPYEEAWRPVFDEQGRCGYIAYIRSSGDSTRYTYLNLYHSTDVTGASDLTAADSSRNPLTTENIIYAAQFGSKVYVCTGGIYNYTRGLGYGGYTERANTFTFDLTSGAGTRSSTGLGFGPEGEYGLQSDNFAAIHTDDNRLTQIQGSQTTVLAWQQNEDQIASRYVERYLSGKSDRNYVVTLRSQGGRAGSPGPLTERATADRNAKGMYLSALPDNLGDLLLEEGIQKKVLAVKAEAEAGGGGGGAAEGEGGGSGGQVPGAGGSLSLDFSLEPGRDYFYEYRWKAAGSGKGGEGVEDGRAAGSGRVEARPQPLLKETSGLGGGGNDAYYVTEVWAEDFNDSRYLPHFRIDENKVKMERYWACDPAAARPGSSSHKRTDQDMITFTVPKGKKALLSFDYDLSFYTPKNRWSENYVTINGKMWEVFQEGGGITGTYMTREFLPEGENEVSFYCTYYGKIKNPPRLIIDNFKVSFLEEIADGEGGMLPEPGGAGLSGGEKSASHSQAEGGWTKARGSFSTPAGAVAYRPAALVHFSGSRDEAKAAGYLTGPQGSPSAYQIEIPQGKAALAARLSVSASSKEQDQNPFFQWENRKWYHYNGSTLQRGYGYDMGTSFDLWLPQNLTGSQTIFMNVPRYTKAAIEGLELFLADSSLPVSSNASWFAAGDQKAYLEWQAYSGKTGFTLEVPGDGSIYYVKDLKLYTYINGVKTYLAQEAFQDEARLAAWKGQGVTASIVEEEVTPEEEAHGLVYRKGELVAYDIQYYDYEKDPSKKSYWKYTHTPFNDGPHPEAAVILDENGQVVSMSDKILHKPITSFQIDGKYTVEHWQEDNTARGLLEAGYPNYDKRSNVETLTFYVEGGGIAPVIQYIRTRPSAVKEGDAYSILIGVDDEDKDVLRLDTELYLNGKKIQSDRRTGITPVNGSYPQISIPADAAAQVGIYEVVCTLRDDFGTGLGSHRFTVISEGKITGVVNHTEEWDQNRKKYNVKRFGEEVNRNVDFAVYAKESPPRKRGLNVFWSGERFQLEAGVGGSPLSVTCRILGENYSTSLKSAGRKNAAGESVYTGVLWSSEMINRWGRQSPEKLTFRFTATYPRGGVKTFDVPVIIDSADDYWLLHRLW